MQVKKKPRNAAAKKIQKAPPKEKRTKKEQTEQPLLKRVIFGEERPDLTELEAGSTTILDILAPTTVDTKSKDYIVVDGVYHTYLYITGYGYATTVGSCWLAPLVEAGEGVNMSFLVKRQSKEKILSKIAQTTMVNRSRMRDVGDTRQDYEELDSAINSGLYLKDVMNRQGEDFYYMHTLIEVTAPDPETLEQRATEVEKLCVSVDMIARRCDYKNEQAFLSSLPILALDPDIERKARRNALTSGVAAAFPFASYELSDHNGIFLGLNLYNRSPVFLDPYDDYKYTNGNWWIGGSTGAGKTVTLQCLGGRLRQQGKRVIIIAPKKGHEFRPLCEKLGGLYLRMSPSSKDCPNLMAIRRKSLDSYAKLKNIAARDDSVLADKISQLIIWFALKKKDLSEEDKIRLDSSLVEVYGRYGITFDNSSIVDENGDFRTMPIISDWYDVLSQNPDTRYLSVVLSRYVTGSAAAMASRNNIDLDNKYIVLDLSGMPDDMIADGTFWATSIAYDLTKWDGAEDSDIEPIKGGLSDSMKRAAYQWGIGRVLYSLDTVWVDIERRGRSYIIKASERKKLDDAYLNALKKLGLEPAAASGIQSLLMPKTAPEQKAAGNQKLASTPAQDQRSGGTAQQSAEPQNRSAQQKPQAGPKKQEHTAEPTGKTVPFRNTAQAMPEEDIYTVLAAKVQGGMSGSNTLVNLETPEKKQTYAYVRGGRPELTPGTQLSHVKLTTRKQDTVVFCVLESYEVYQQGQQAA